MLSRDDSRVSRLRLLKLRCVEDLTPVGLIVSRRLNMQIHSLRSRNSFEKRKAIEKDIFPKPRRAKKNLFSLSTTYVNRSNLRYAEMMEHKIHFHFWVTWEEKRHTRKTWSCNEWNFSPEAIADVAQWPPLNYISSIITAGVCRNDPRRWLPAD